MKAWALTLAALLAVGCHSRAHDGGGDNGGGPDGAVPAGGCKLGIAPVRQLAYARGGQWLAAAELDGWVTVLDLAGTTVRRIHASDQGVALVALSEDGARLVTSSGGLVRVWSVSDGGMMRELSLGGGRSVSLALSGDQDPLVLASAESGSDNVKVWQLSDGALMGTTTGSPLATFTHSDTALLLFDEASSRFQVVSFTGQVVREAVSPEPLTRVAFAADGAFFAGVTADGHVATMSVDDDDFTWRSERSVPVTRQLLFLESPWRIVQLAQPAVAYDRDDGTVALMLPRLDDADVVAAAPDSPTIAAINASGELMLVSSTDANQAPLRLCAANH